jgi:hypothetical protein
MNLIGNKNTFALEYEFLKNSPMDDFFSRFWIKGQILGDIKNPSPFDSIYIELKQIINDKLELSTQEFSGLQPKEIYMKFFPCKTYEEEMELPEDAQEKLQEYDKYRFDFNQSYDIYVIRIYIEKEDVCFVWKLVEHAIERFPEYGSEVKFATAPWNEIKNVFLEFEKDLKVEELI